MERVKIENVLQDRHNLLKDDSRELICQVLFFTALIIEIGIVIVDKSALINPIEGRLFQFTFLLCAIKIALTKYNCKEWLLILCFLSVGIVVDQVTNQNEVIRFVAFVAASKNIDQKKALKFVFWITFIGVLLLVAMSLLGILGDVYLEADYYRGTGVEKRYCFGLGHPNAFHCMVWAITTLGIYVYYESMKWWHYPILLFANVVIFIFTDSRTGFLVTCVSIFSGIFASLFKKIASKNLIYYIVMLVLMMCVIFSIVVACYTGRVGDTYIKLPVILDKLNQKMTGRIFEGGYVGAISKWRLFSTAKEKGYLDMGYIKLFYWYGIIPALLYIISILLLILYGKRHKRIDMLIIILSFSLYTVAEAHVISPYFARNYLLMLFFGLWSEIFFVDKGKEGFFWQVKKMIRKNNV